MQSYMCIIEPFVFSFAVAFFSMVFARMLTFVMTYGEVLDWFKILVAKRVNPIDTNMILDSVRGEKLSTAQELMGEHYDYLCNESKVIQLLDCPYCLGFWISFISGIVLVAWFPMWVVVITPIFSFYLQQRL